MKYWLPIWLVTLLIGLQGWVAPSGDSNGMSLARQDAGAKLIGGLAPPGGPDGPDSAEGELP